MNDLEAFKYWIVRQTMIAKMYQHDQAKARLLVHYYYIGLEYLHE